MIEPKPIPRDEFPKSEIRAEGMIALSIRCDNDAMKDVRDIR